MVEAADPRSLSQPGDLARRDRGRWRGLARDVRQGAARNRRGGGGRAGRADQGAQRAIATRSSARAERCASRWATSRRADARDVECASIECHSAAIDARSRPARATSSRHLAPRVAEQLLRDGHLTARSTLDRDLQAFALDALAPPRGRGSRSQRRRRRGAGGRKFHRRGVGVRRRRRRAFERTIRRWRSRDAPAGLRAEAVSLRARARAPAAHARLATRGHAARIARAARTLSPARLRPRISRPGLDAHRARVVAQRAGGANSRHGRASKPSPSICARSDFEGSSRRATTTARRSRWVRRT